MKSKLSMGLWGLAAVLSAGVALVSYRYLAAEPPAGAENVMANLFVRPWLAVHVAGAATALLVAGFQFLPAIRRRRPVHRWLGRVYATGCIVGGLAGLRLAFGTSAGAFAGMGFGLLAICWLYATTQAWRYARERRFDEHRAWMIRSFAMTFAAVTLRLYLPIAPILGYDFMDGYRLIAWLAWVPNLIVAELYLMRGRRRLATAPAA